MTTKRKNPKLYVVFERVPYRALPGDAELSSRELTQDEFRELLAQSDAFLYHDTPPNIAGLESFREELVRHNISLPTKTGHGEMVRKGSKGYRLIAGDLLVVISVMGCLWDRDKKPCNTSFSYKLLRVCTERRQAAKDRVLVRVRDLKDIQSWARAGEGDILNMNNPQMAAAQLNRIFQKARRLLKKS